MQPEHRDASTLVLPSDVLLNVAECLLDLVDVADFLCLLNVHSTFLHAGLSRRYGWTSLDYSERSVKLLQRISSEPLLATRVRTLSINFCASSKRRVKGQVLAKALTQAIPYITYLRRLEIIWAKREAGYYDPTVALKIFASPLVALWTRAAPTLRELRADVYIDALSVVAKLDASSAPNLRAIDLRVYGGMVPENTGTAGVKAHLSDIAHSLVLPAAHRLEVLEIYLVFPTCLQYPVPPFDDFWELLQANRFPRLSKLGVATPFFDSVCPFVAGLVTACVRHGRLKTLLLEPTFSGSQTGPFIHYLHMIHEHGGRWDGLRALTLFLVDGTYLETMRCPPVGEGDFFASFAGPLLSTSSLQDLSLTGHFMTRGNLRETLQTLHHGGGGDSLRRLAVKVHIVRPSTFDVLSELVPFIESLRLEMIDVRPDGELTPALLSSLQAEVDIRAAELAKQLAEPNDANPRPAHVSRRRALVHERLFMLEMSARRFETWSLRRAEVVGYDWSGPGCAGNTPPRDVIVAATALQRSVPGLVLTRVHPMASLWWP